MIYVLGVLLLVALGIAVLTFATAVHFARVAHRAQDEAQATRLALVEALTRAADEQMGKESALRLLDAETRLRREAEAALTGELVAFKSELERLQRAARAIGIDAPTWPRRVH